MSASCLGTSVRLFSDFNEKILMFLTIPWFHRSEGKILIEIFLWEGAMIKRT